MNEETLAIIKDLIEFATRMVNERNEAREDLARTVSERDTAHIAFKLASNERDDLRASLKRTTDLLAEAEEKIETFKRGLDTEVRR